MNKIQIVEDVLTKEMDANATVADWVDAIKDLNRNYTVDVTENLDSYTLNVWFHREETDAEYDKRVEKINRVKDSVQQLLKKTRYQEYLKLKEEFEPNDKDI